MKRAVLSHQKAKGWLWAAFDPTQTCEEMPAQVSSGFHREKIGCGRSGDGSARPPASSERNMKLLNILMVLSLCCMGAAPAAAQGDGRHCAVCGDIEESTEREEVVYLLDSAEAPEEEPQDEPAEEPAEQSAQEPEKEREGA